MRVCLDTNVLISSIFWKGTPGRILDLWVEDRFDLVGTLPILSEYQRVLKRLSSKADDDIIETWIRTLVEKLILVIPGPTVKKWTRDIHDDKFIEGAMAGRVDYLVTGDRDLLDLKTTFPFRILRPKQFLIGIMRLG